MLFRAAVTSGAGLMSVRALSSVGRAEPLQGLGREFEPLSAHQIKPRCI